MGRPPFQAACSLHSFCRQALCLPSVLHPCETGLKKWSRGLLKAGILDMARPPSLPLGILP